MAYDLDLADRLRELLIAEDGVVEKRMFGGLAFLVAGHMAAAVGGGGGGGGGLMMRETERLRGDPRTGCEAGPLRATGRASSSSQVNPIHESE